MKALIISDETGAATVMIAKMSPALLPSTGIYDMR